MPDRVHAPRGLGGGGTAGGLGSNTEVLGLSDTAFVLLRDLIERRTGMYFDDAKRPLLADKLSELVTSYGLTSFLDYYYLLRYDSAADEHWSRLADRLAVPETYFWRQSEQLDALARVVAPAHFSRHGDRPLRIWSAACCTGEEPLSIAIALAEAGWLDRRPVEIVGSDASRAMLDRARRGVYGERAFRQLPPDLKRKYFTYDGNGAWRPDGLLSARIQWRSANLADRAQTAPLASADVIFCRNVFIYFSDAAIRNVVDAFADYMPDDGHLFLGASESLTRLSQSFDLVEIERGFAYVKSGRPTEADRGGRDVPIAEQMLANRHVQG